MFPVDLRRKIHNHRAHRHCLQRARLHHNQNNQPRQLLIIMESLHSMPTSFKKNPRNVIPCIMKAAAVPLMNPLVMQLLIISARSLSAAAAALVLPHRFRMHHQLPNQIVLL